MDLLLYHFTWKIWGPNMLFLTVNYILKYIIKTQDIF